MANKYLNTVGGWSVYRDLKSLDQVPERLEQVTTAFFGLSGLSSTLRDGFSANQLKGKGVLAAILAVHTIEQATGALTTASIRFAGRGQPLARYRGIIVRRSPFATTRTGQADRLAGRKLLDAKGYYFHEGGRTWHAQSRTFLVQGTPRTLTRVSSLSLPYREHFFDRPLILGDAEAGQVGADGETRSVYLQRLIDVIKGDEDPSSIPGYIGSTNELENIVTPLGDLKRALFAANWFLVDESERDDPAANNDFVDYDTLLHPENAAAKPGYYQLQPPGQKTTWPPVTAQRSYARPIQSTPAPTSTNPYSRLTAPAPPAAKSIPVQQPTSSPTSIPVRQQPGPAQPSAPNLSPIQPAPGRSGPPVTKLPMQPAVRASSALGNSMLGPPITGGKMPKLEMIQNRWRMPDGHEYPILIDTVITNPITKARTAKNAWIYTATGWRQIVDDQELTKLAAAYDRGEQTTIDEGGSL